MIEPKEAKPFPGQGIAVVLGASGGIGSAMQSLLEAHSDHLSVIGLSRRSDPPLDVTDEDSLDAAFAKLGETWGSLDFVVHAIAFSDKAELSGRFIDTSKANFQTSLSISCYSLIDVARRAMPLMTQGGAILTLTYQGSNKVTPYYNVMGVAKAALESTVRYLANDLGPQGIRVNALSPGPMKTLAGAAIGGARKTFRMTEANAPLRANATLEAVGGTAVYLASDYGACTTGEIIHVDGGYHVLGMPQSENL